MKKAKYLKKDVARPVLCSYTAWTAHKETPSLFMDFKQDKLHAYAHMVMPHLHVIMLLARLEQMKCIFICLQARWVTRGQTTKSCD
jgi:hypothetical protein